LLSYKTPVVGISNLPYPSDWQRSENQSQVYFYPPVEDNNNTDSVLKVRRFPTLGKTLDNYVGDDINYFKQNTTGFQLIDFIVTSMVGNPAYKIVYTYKNLQYEKQYKETDFYTIANNAVYIISYIEQPERYSNYLDIMQQMLTSLKIQKANNSAQVDKAALKLANTPTGLTVNPITHTLYVDNGGSNIISVIDTKTNRIINNISVGITPNDVYIDKTGNVLYVVNGGSNTVSVIDTLTNKVISNPKVGSTPASLIGDSYDGFVFVANRDSNTVSVINAEAFEVLSNIKVGSQPYGVAVNPITHTLYVVNGGSNSVTLISYYIKSHSFKISKITNIRVGNSPTGIGIDPNTNKVYVTNSDDNTISVIDGSLNSVVKTVEVGAGPFLLAVNPNTNMIYVTNNNDNTISVIDGKTNKVTETITVGYHPWSVAVNPNTNMTYVTNADLNEIYVINDTTNHVTAGVTFKMDSGDINCNGRKVSNNDYNMYDINTIVNCKAEPGSGFLFSSWSGDLASNNTATNPVLHFNVTRYGTLTANFVKAPSPAAQVILPKEYWDSIYSIVIGVIVAPIAGWLVPFVVDYKEKKRQLRYLRTYIPLIDNIYEEHRQNIGECMQLLEQERVDISALLQQGIINDSSFGILNDRISEYIEEVNNNNNM
ncbi:MAG TPA: YncE family protein, partial [Nitrososphaeraceae archaeon]|nr:YncE family protein [Nitrososphaeraceae archaeon]